MLKYVSLFLTILALTSIAFVSLDESIPLAPVKAQNATLQNPTVRIDPAESVVDVGETFTITVMIDRASDFGGFEFDLVFITTTVTVDDVTLGDFLGSTGRTVFPVVSIIDNKAGEVTLGAITFGNDPGPDGTGALATIALTTQGVGISPLNLQDIEVFDTTGASQEVTAENGTVVAGGAPSQKIYLPLVLKGW